MELFGRVDGELRWNLREALCELFLGDLLKLLINLEIGVEQLVAFGGQRRAMGAVPSADSVSLMMRHALL